MALDQHVISRIFQFSLAYFGARSIKILTFSVAENCYLFLSKFPHCLHALSTLSINKFEKNEIFFVQVFPSYKMALKSRRQLLSDLIIAFF